MKPFLGIDLTTNKKNEQMNGEEFVVAKPALSLTQSLESSSENVEETIEKSKLPLPIRIGHWICGAVGVLVAIGIIKALGGEDSVTLIEAYQNASWLFWLGGACLVAWALLKLISVRKEKNVLETEESSQVFNNLDKTCEAILADLNVPQDSKEIDVLSFFYKVKDDNIPPHLKNYEFASREDKKNKANYKYPHDFGGYVEQQYLPDALKGKVYYQPKNNGYENVVKEIRKKKGKKD